MDSCKAVELELEKALLKLNGLNEHSERVLLDSIQQITLLKRELSEVPEDFVLSDTQKDIIKDTIKRCKDVAGRLATEHRDAHSSVSRVGKAIDRNFVMEYENVAPRSAQFYTDEIKKQIDIAIAQHLHREGLDSTTNLFCQEANIEPVTKVESYTALQKIASEISKGNPQPALVWIDQHKSELANSPLPFALHRLGFIETAAKEGNAAAVQYAKTYFPQFAKKHEKEIQQAMCYLAYCYTEAPRSYSDLKDRKTLAIIVSDLFVREACSILHMSPLSPLAGAVAAGSRVLPALLEIKAKLAHPQASAWSNTDDLPVEVDFGGEGDGFHSVFSCPILRQQASESNPPMRLLCGHVITRDALTKLTHGVKLKCPYCPMEQPQSEAKQIFF